MGGLLEVCDFLSGAGDFADNLETDGNQSGSIHIRWTASVVAGKRMDGNN